ncbi:MULTISPECIES: hypothetical protein [Thermococcus]|uniref:Uncharacterized protein n=2 Tax=Thermococcus TaxID=2263 RepID=A0A5C0SJ41_9EURY|nr:MULTISPECIES: hypothetical protein [Thermococcus]QEK14555.1 hypothetical protein FPV09_04940 [Thermococcus aciditolerans]
MRVMRNKVVIGLLVIFAVMVILGVGPWWDNIIGDVSPPPPNVSAIYLGVKNPDAQKGWQFVVEDSILTDCMVAYIYSFDHPGKLTVYELDGGTLNSLGLNFEVQNCTNVRRYGVLAVNFTERPDVLSIEIWVSKSSTGGNDVYFQQLGNWRFVNGSYIGFTAPPMNDDYALLDIEKVRELMNATGIHYINRR